MKLIQKKTLNTYHNDIVPVSIRNQIARNIIIYQPRVSFNDINNTERS